MNQFIISGRLFLFKRIINLLQAEQLHVLCGGPGLCIV